MQYAMFSQSAVSPTKMVYHLFIYFMSFHRQISNCADSNEVTLKDLHIINHIHDHNTINKFPNMCMSW